jgi:hypothetical protein
MFRMLISRRSLLLFVMVLLTRSGWLLGGEQDPVHGQAFSQSATVGRLHAVVSGTTEISPQGYRREQLEFSEDTINDLASIGGEPVVVSGWPVAPGDRHTVQFRLLQVYAPDARVWVVDGETEREIPRSSRVHLSGLSVDDDSVRLVLSVESRNKSLRGSVTYGTKEYQIVEQSFNGKKRQQIAESADLLLETGADLKYGCSFDETPWRVEVDRLQADPEAESVSTKATSLRQIIVAVDTDNEFNWKRFSNNAAEAEDWIADLFAEMTALYERDLDLRILKGDTILRFDSNAPAEYNDDPYAVLGSPADRPHLDEFGDYWAANLASVNRTFAMLLSGKSASPLYSSGIAWVDGYCEKQSYGGGYSVSQIFTASYVPLSSNLRVIAHELGHNLGSPHTHCYSPPVDYCFACESGCYSGTVSCPSGGPGTLMSYCHVQTDPASCSATCGDNSAELHSRVATRMDGYVTSHIPSCVSLVGADGIFDDGFEGSNTNAWSSRVP